MVEVLQEYSQKMGDAGSFFPETQQREYAIYGNYADKRRQGKEYRPSTVHRETADTMKQFDVCGGAWTFLEKLLEWPPIERKEIPIVQGCPKNIYPKCVTYLNPKCANLPW